MEFSFDLCHGCVDTDTPEKEMPKPIKAPKEPIKIQPLSEPIDIPIPDINYLK